MMDPNGFPMQPPQQPPAGYPVPTQSPQQFPFYPNAMPSFPPAKNQQPQQQPQQPPQQQHSFAPMPMQHAGPGGPMMPAAFPQQSPGPHANFSAPFSQPPIPASMNQFVPPQSAPTTATNLPATTAPSFPQNMNSMPPNNMAQQPQPQQPAQQPQQQQPQQQRPMPQSTPSQSSTQSAAQSPASSREKARVSTLLDINSMLLQEVVNLQASGKAGVPPPQGSQDSNNPSPSSEQGPDATKASTQKPSPEYVDCMRRLQANLAYLATIADRAKKSGGVAPQAPAIMTPPPHMPAMNDIYNKLSDLFPRSAQGGTPQPSPQSQGNGKPSPSSMVESVV